MSDAEKLLQELDQLLGQEIEAHQQLLDCQRTEKQLLMAQSLEPFVANLQAKEHLLRQMTHLEDTRQRVLARLAPLVHLTGADVTLHRLSTRVDAPYASTLRQHRARLQQLVNALHQCNRENDGLLQHALTFINGALAFFDNLVQANPTYHRTGKYPSATQGRLLSNRV